MQNWELKYLLFHIAENNNEHQSVWPKTAYSNSEEERLDCTVTNMTIASSVTVSERRPRYSGQRKQCGQRQMWSVLVSAAIYP